MHSPMLLDLFRPWGSGTAWWNALATTVTGVACLCIGIALLLLPVRRPDLGRVRLVLAASACVLADGLAHLLPLTTLCVSSGWAHATAHLATAMLSSAAAMTVWPLILRVADSPSPSRLLAINAELSRLQASTAESNRGLLLAEQLAHIGHWRVSQPDGQLSWSDEVFRIYGLPIGAPPLLEEAFAAYHPEDRDMVRRNFEACLAAGSSYEFKSRLVRPSGEIRYVRSLGAVQLGADGRPSAISGVFIDITAQIEAEAEKAAACERLAAAQRMEALGRLAGGVAHDINNVLQTIATASGLIDRRVDDPAEVARLNRLVGKTADRARAVVDRLLASARRGALRSSHLDAASLLAGLAHMLDYTLGGSVRVRLDIEDGLPPIWADGDQLETVLVNLATNARDAMPHGGTITLAAAAERRRPGDPLPAELGSGAFVRLSVTDTGTGMSEAVLARAVEPFYTTKPRGKGTGLGLSMAGGFAGQSGGAMQLSSVEGEGTCVTIWLPQCQPAQAPAEPAARSAIWRLPGTTVLVVDDDAVLRGLLAEDLAECGMTVLQAGSSRGALDLLAGGEAVDVLVTDLSMPGLDGVGLIEAARRHRRTLPAILLTGHTPEDARLNASVADPGTTLLTKPVRAAELAEQIVQLLGLPGQAPGLEDVLAA